MTRKDLKNQIRLLKNLSEVTAPRPEWLKSNREILLMQVKNTNTRITDAGFNLQKVWNILNIFLPRQIINYGVRPVLSLASIVGLLFGGWITGVSASYSSLPGDTLYSVKLATENVRTTVASKPQSVKLHVEFAGRRAEEVRQIVTSNLSKPEKEQKVQEAVDHLKSDMNQAKTAMDEIKKDQTITSSATIIDVAKAVDQKTNEIQKNLDQSKVELAKDTLVTVQSSPAQEQVKQATAITLDTGVKAVEILVEKHNEDNNSVLAQDVKTAVDNKLKTLEDKVGSIENQMTQVTNSTTTAVGAIQQSDAKNKADKVKLVEPVKETTDAAKVSISQAKDELSKDNLGAAMDKIKEGSALTLAAEVKADATKILVVPVSVVTSTVEKTNTAAVVPAPDASDVKAPISTQKSN